MSYVVDIIRADEIEVGMKVWIRTKGFHELRAVTSNVLIGNNRVVCVWWEKPTDLGRGAMFRVDEEVIKIHDEEGK